MKGCLTHTRASSVGGFVDVVINDQSARKTPNLLGFDSDDDRVIGDAALALLIRTPAKVFPHVKRLIGAAHASQAAKQFQQDFPMIRMKPDEERNTILFERDGDEPLSVEEVIVQLLQVARQQAFDHLKATSPDPADHKQIERVVATVPEYFTTAQRTLYTQLIQLAGFDTPAQLNELTAVCIDFAVRTLIDGAPKQKVAILGSGSLGTSASLFEMSRSGDKITLKVLSTASDPMVGGFRFDLAIREQLIKRFDATQKSDAPSVRTNQRAMGKLLREARELKEMLSVSTSIEVAIEELFGGKDFKTTVTQEELHSWTSDLVESMVSPLRRVLSGVDGVTGIELFGGSIRGPAIQAAIKAEFPSIPLGKHIDTEESALLGAAHYAGVESGISKLIRVIVDESSVIPVAVGDSDWDLILSVDQQAQLAKKIQLLDDKAAERRSRDAARNALESALNDARDLIQSASSRASVSAAARATLDSAITAGAAFIDDADRATPAAAFDDKRRALLDAMEPVRPPKKVEPVGKPAAPRKKRDRRKEHGETQHDKNNAYTNIR